MLLKTHVEKMSLFAYASISMKISRLLDCCHYIVENISTYAIIPDAAEWISMSSGSNPNEFDQSEPFIDTRIQAY
jgi:hypothetical protein